MFCRGDIHHGAVNFMISVTIVVEHECSDLLEKNSLWQVYGWGRGEHGRLGFGDDKSSKMVPQRVQLLICEDIVQVLI